jgi:glycine hydroxymethyltransferase
LMVDMAHFSGLGAGGVWKGKYDPAKYADIITSTTHKTLRCPRGGIVFCKEAYKPYVDKGCPHVLGGPLGQVIAAKGVAFRELETPEFKDYAHQVVRNAQALAQALVEGGAKILTGGTDNHMVIIDVEESFGLNGRQAEKALLAIGISLNRNTIPNDKNGPWYTSGVRLGTPACTTRGLKEDDMKQIGQWMCSHLHAVKPDPDSKANYYVDNAKETEMASAVQNMLLQFPLYPELD